MPRKKLILSTEFPYHLTARTNNREIFHGDFSYTWKVLTGELFLQQVLHGLRIHAFVLMPNHIHLLATSPGRGIDLIMKEALGSSTRILNTRLNRSGHVFGGRYSWSLIQQADYYAHALKYVLRNPVKAGLCAEVSDYPYSSYSGLVGEAHLPLAITPPQKRLGRFIPSDSQKLDEWLNSAHAAEQNEAIRKALKRKEFAFGKTAARRKENFPI